MKNKILSLLILSVLVIMIGSVSATISSITVNSPNGGEYWSGTKDITWTAGGVEGDTIDILYTSGAGWPVIKGFGGYDDSPYLWDTSSLTDGASYQILIRDSNDFKMNDLSSTFTIDNTDPVVTVSVTNPTNTDTQLITGTFTEENIDNITVNGAEAVIDGSDYSITVADLVEGSNPVIVVATDLAGNTKQISDTIVVDTIAPTVEVSGAPTNWLVDTGLNAGTTCDDGDDSSGCDALSYKYKFYDAEPTCSNTYSEYTDTNPVTSHKWVCVAAKDNVENIGYSSPVEFKVHDTIQEAIDDATVGDTINVAAGTYTEDLTIDKSLTLNGGEEATIKGNHRIEADDITIESFTFDLTTSPSVGFYLTSISDLEITNNVFNGPVNKVCNPWKIGGHFGSPMGYEVNGFLFEDNQVNSCSIPINLQDENINKITINNNVFRDTDGVVYVWGEGTPTGILSNFIFTNNDIDSSNAYGIGIDLNGETVFDDDNFGVGNQIYHNKFVGIVGAYGFEAVSILSSGDYELDAETNYWGCPTGANTEGCSETSDNVDYTPWAYNEDFDVDTTKPVSIIDSPDANSWQKESFNVSVSDSDTIGESPDTDVSKLATCYYQVTSNNVVTVDWTSRTCNTQQLITVGSSANCKDEGTDKCKVETYAIDVAGNEGAIDSRTFSIDWTEPTATILIDADATYTGDTSVELTLTYGDNLDSVLECRYANSLGDLDTANWESCADTKVWTITVDDNTKTVYYEVKDDAGNVKQVTDTIILDTLEPEITGIADMTALVNQAIEICATIIDDGSGVASAKLYYDSSNVAMTSGDSNSWCGTIPASEEYTGLTYYVVAIDQATKETTSSTYNIEIFDFAIELEQGWNLISIPLIPTDSNGNVDTSIDAVFNSILSAVSYDGVYTATILRYNAVDETWYKARPLAEHTGFTSVTGSSSTKVETIVPGYAYWVKIDQAVTLKGFGEKVDSFGMPPSVDLGDSWNLIGKYGLTNVKKQNETGNLAFESGLKNLKDYPIMQDGAFLSETNELQYYNGYWALLGGNNGNPIIYTVSELDYAE